jgi:hypothetical protein
MIESKLKAAAMDSAGELPDMGNLLLREGGFPHLPNPRFVPAAKWNDAGTKPLNDGVFETQSDAWDSGFQHFNGFWWGAVAENPVDARAHENDRELFPINKWREVQP